MLVRHAVHDRVDHVLCGRMAGVELGEAGRRQALALAAALRPGAVFTSPQPRCRQTATPIAEAHGQTAIIEAALDEIDFGDWTGRNFAALADDAEWKRWNERRAIGQPPNGEPMAAVQRRMLNWLHRLPLTQPDRTVVAVSHGDVIKAAVAGVLGLTLDAHGRFDIAPASVSAIALWAGGGRVQSLNQAVAA